MVEDTTGCGQGANCRPLLSFHGPALAFGSVLTYCARGGQILLSEAAWESVKPTIFQHPGAVQVKSMGVHIISDDFPTPMLLMEVMPNLLAKRYFPPIVTQRMLEPGFREAPAIDYPMAIVFAKVCMMLPIHQSGCFTGTTQQPNSSVHVPVVFHASHPSIHMPHHQQRQQITVLFKQQDGSVLAPRKGDFLLAC